MLLIMLLIDLTLNEHAGDPAGKELVANAGELIEAKVMTAS